MGVSVRGSRRRASIVAGLTLALIVAQVPARFPPIARELPPAAAAAVAGYDALLFASDSAWHTVLSPGQSLQYSVMFVNTGTTTWTNGTPTEVDLAVCDDTACDIGSPNATWSPSTNGWISPSRYARPSESVVAPGQIATFGWGITAPSAAAPGVYAFQGDLVVAATGQTIHRFHYQRRVLVPGAVYTVTDASDSLTSTTCGASCTLRGAMTAAAATTSASQIAFAIPADPAVTVTIQVAAPLPTITTTTWIDATTQPAYTSSKPVIQLDGSIAATADGFVVSAPSSLVRGFAIGNFGGAGVRLQTTDAQIVANRIGTDPAGLVARPNTVGVVVQGSGNVVGGTNASDRNLISGNKGDAVSVQGAANAVLGNYVGSDAAGGAALPNGGVGIVVSNASGNIIGGSAGGAGNVVSGNGADGIAIRGEATANVVQGNYVGVNAAGSAALGNARDGVVVVAFTGNTVGGTDPGAGNVVSANGRNGIVLGYLGSGGTTVEGNLVGTDATGTKDISNLAAPPTGGTGIQVESPNNVIGAPGAGNVVAGNSVGIAVGEPPGGTGTPNGNVIRGNFIGVTRTLAPLANDFAGIRIEGSSNVIGGDAAGESNTIAHNGAAGILIGSGAGNTIVRNSITANGGRGIRLAAGANNGIVPPSITAVQSTGTNLVVSGTAVPGASTVAIYADPADQGAQFLAETTPDASGNWKNETWGSSTDVTALLASLKAGSLFLRATATDGSGNTSQFSGARVAYVYDTDTVSRDAFSSLLVARGYVVDSVTVAAAATTDFSLYTAIVIGNDTGSLATWGTAAAVKQIAGAGRRIVGIGEGGYAFFGKLGLTIGYPNGWHTFGTSATVVDGANQLWTTPNATNLATGASAGLYIDTTNEVAIYNPTAVTGVFRLGRQTGDTTHYPLIAQQQGACDVLWGFSQSPADMATAGLGPDVFQNAIAGNPCGAPTPPTIIGVARCGDVLLPGARVDLFSGTALVATTTADTTAAFAFSDIAPGTYSIRFILGRTTCGAPVTVAAGSTANVSGAPAILDLHNHSWPSAYGLAPMGNPGLAVSADEHLFRQGQSAWFKFTVKPGAAVVVTLKGAAPNTSLPANYDITLYKSISATYQALTSPTQLVRIGAESSPDAFSPDAFSPDAFSPDAFSPDAFSPDAFSPDAFSPDAFSPDAFSPDAFSPDAFSPDAFSPDAFSPDAFSPDAFSPAAFSPDAFSPDAFSPDAFSPDAFSATCSPSATQECVSPTAYSSAQTRSLIAVSAFDGTASEGIYKHTWDNDGVFYVRVKGRNGAFSLAAPFHLEVTYLAGTCELVAPIASSPTQNLITGTAGGYKTIILTDSSRITGTDLDKTALPSKLASLATATSGVVVDVSQDDRVKAANAQADQHNDCPYAKNLVAGEIKRIVQSYRDAPNPIEYVVIVGGDSAIPFFRSPDQAGVGSEKDYVPPVRDTSASQASLKLGYVLGQDAYGATTTLSLKDHTFPVPNAAVGRLVETAGDAAGLIDAFLAQTVVTPRSALVTGYDFMSLAAVGPDGLGGVKHELDAAIGGTSDALVEAYGLAPTDPTAWNADQLRTKLLGSRHDLIFLGGHFSAVSALAADYATRMLSTDVVNSTLDLTNVVVFSQGCHSGYNIVDGDAIPSVTLAPDFPQAFARKRATVIAGTGYQYGDTDFVAYNEQVYVNFAQQLRTGSGAVSVGKALVAAKQQYLDATTQLKGIDEKALLETTLFGLPMLAVNVPGNRITPAPSTSIVTATTPAAARTPGFAYNLTTADVAIPMSSTTHTVNVRDLSKPAPATITMSYLSGSGGIVTNPAEPVLPLELRDVTVAGTVLRGAGFRGGTFSDTANVQPLTGAPATEIRGIHAPFVSTVLYPIRPWTVNYFDALSGGETRLAITPSQFVSSAPDSATGTRRAFTRMDFRLFYSAHLGAAAVSAAPSVAHVAGIPDGSGNVHFAVRVTGDPSAGVQAVWIDYATVGGATWTPVDLVQQNDDSTLWTATLALGGASATDLRYLVQAASGVGLVSLDTNHGSFYTPGPDTVVPSAPKSSTTLALRSPAASGTYREGQQFTAVLGGANPLAGRVVSFGVGSERRRGVTDANGIASATLPLYQTPGAYRITASFDETSDLLGSSDAAPFTIAKQGTSVALSFGSSIVQVGSSTSITATLTDASALHRTLRDQTVFFVTGGPNGTSATTAITDYAGRASLTVSLPAGVYTVVASFSGPIDLGNGQSVDLVDERYSPSSASAMLVFYDPSTFATGGGWITTSSSSVGVPVGKKANFGFNLKYQTGTTIPTGSLEFQVKDAALNFKATSFAWLAISGSRAEYEGTGTVNAAGSYGFHVIADQSLNTFQIWIWNPATGGSYAAPTYQIGGPLGGGSLKIHS